MVFILLVLLTSLTAGQDAIVMQYMTILFISLACLIKERKLISYCLRRHQSVTKTPLKEYLKEISFFGFTNFSNSFTSWGDVLLIGLLFDPELTAAYFLLTRVFTGCERIAIIPLYPVYNFLGKEFQRNGYILRTNALKIVPAFVGYSAILLFGSIGLTVALDILPNDIFTGLDVISLPIQVALLLSMFIVSSGTVIEHISLVTGFQKMALVNSLGIIMVRLCFISIMLLVLEFDFILYIFSAVVIILSGRMVLLRKMLLRSK